MSGSSQIPLPYVLVAVLPLLLVVASGTLESVGRHLTSSFPYAWILAGRRARWFRIGWPIASGACCYRVQHGHVRREVRPMTGPRRVRLPVILAIFVLSGAAGLIYEVVWSRQLVLVFGNTTQAVSAILTGFFGGMAIGSVRRRPGRRPGPSPLRLYGMLELVLVVVVILTPITFRLLHEVYRGAFAVARGTARAARSGPVRAGAPRPRAGDDPDGRDAADADPPSRPASGHLSGAFGRLYAANTHRGDRRHDRRRASCSSSCSG